MARGVSDNGRAGQRRDGHASPIGEPEQQGPSDIQSLPSAAAVFYPSGVPKPPLLVQHRRGLSGGEGRDSLEEGSVGMNPPHSASDAGAKHIPGGSIRKGRSYRTPYIPREQEISPFCSCPPPFLPFTSHTNKQRKGSSQGSRESASDSSPRNENLLLGRHPRGGEPGSGSGRQR